MISMKLKLITLASILCLLGFSLYLAIPQIAKSAPKPPKTASIAAFERTIENEASWQKTVLDQEKTALTRDLKQLTTAKPTPNDFCINFPVLMYHHIQPADLAKKEEHGSLNVDNKIFDEQMKYLSEHGYQTVFADELSDVLQNQQNPKGKNIIVTLDDGYEDIYQYAFPLAQKYSIKLNLMIPTGLVGKKGYLTWDQLKEMQQSRLIAIYNHTTSHYPLNLGTKEKVEEEVLTARKDLENNLGIPSFILTYPYGAYDSSVINIIKGLGFQAAFTTHSGSRECLSQIFALRRIRIGNLSLDKYGL